MAITPTRCFEKVAKLDKTIRVVQGGTSAGKTFSILLYLIYFCLNPKRKLHISIVAESVPVLKRGAEKDFFKILMENGLYDERNHNKTDRTYKLVNSLIEFFPADDANKLRGSRRDILFVNEANNVSWEAFQELNVRTRLFSFIDYNPTAIFWANTELVGSDNVDFLIVNYRDNEFLEQKIIDEIESWKVKGETSQYFLNKWKVMGLGEIGIQQGSIYTDWSIIEELPDDAELLNSGLDFGFSNDPTALVAVYRFDGEIIVDQVLYSKGLLNSQIATAIKNDRAAEGIIYADSAEPKTIAELRNFGLAVMPVFKGKDSINYGIQLIQSQPIKVTARSIKLIEELNNYTWMKDRDGNFLSVPIDKWNHALDALRYFFLMKMGNNKSKFSLKWKR